ncbi:MAG: DUF6597 domain-containing transcriptional factor [Pyrinomonadaceae bacterium]
MEYFEAPPSSDVSGFVKLFWSVRADAAGSAAHEPVLPDGCPEVVVNCADPFERRLAAGSEIQPRVLISGQILRAVHIRPTGRVDLFGVRFQPWGARALFGMPMSSLAGMVEGLSAVDPPLSRELEGAIAEHDSFSSRQAAFEKILRRRAAHRAIGLELPRAAVEAISAACGPVSVRQLSAGLGVGERRLQRVFRESVGLSPKSYSRIDRFQKMLRYLGRSHRLNVLDTAYSLGYYDQSHLIRDFKEIAGFTPGAFENSGDGISGLLIGGV